MNSQPSNSELVRKFAESCLYHPKFEDILQLIQDCHYDSRDTSEPLCALIEGDRGVGKTTLLQTYCQRHPRRELSTKTKVTVIYAEIPEAATPPSLVGAMLASLGDPYHQKGTYVARTHRLKVLLEQCETELIIMDEFQHFIDRRSEFAQTKISDWLKGLINSTRIPLILVGMPNSHEILDSNPQLKRRFAFRRTLPSFGWADKDQQKEFRTLLKEFSQAIPFETKPILSDEETAHRFYVATAGKISEVKHLLERALKRALVLGEKELTIGHIAFAFDEKGLEEINPFTATTSALANLKPSPEVIGKTSTRVFKKRKPIG